MSDEAERVLRAYEARKLRAKERFFTFEDVAHVCRMQERHRETLLLLARGGLHPLSELRLLDVGCGDGNMPRQYLQWGARPENVAGIELRPEPVEHARALNPNLDLRCGSGTELPWPDASFDIVSQHTVFTSILDDAVKQQVAREMTRVLRPGGSILWYDFCYDNPRNRDVKGVPPREVRALFPGFRVDARRITLVPFVARRLPVAALPVLYPLLASLTPLRTSYLGLLTRP